MNKFNKFWDELTDVVNAKVGIAALICVVIAIIVGLASIPLGTVWIKTNGNPEDTVILYYNALVENDYDLARTYMKDSHSFIIENSLENEDNNAFKTAFENSFSYELIGNVQTKGLDARGSVKFSYLNIDLLEEKISECIKEVLNRKIDELPKNKIYDKDGNYQQSFLDLVYNTALNESIVNKDELIKTDTYDVTLQYDNSKWLITSEDKVLSTNVEVVSTNAKINVLNDYLADNQIVRKVYKIEGNAVPKPKEENFKVVSSAGIDEVLEVIERAKESGLLEGQEVAFNKDSNFSGDIHYYYDETILVIAWNEYIEGHLCGYCEVKLADASQFRRKIADDTYGSGKQYYCSLMAKQTNAVAAMNADFYTFRNFGITVYDKEVRRVDNSLDNLFIDKNGDFLFVERGNKKTKEELQTFVNENGVKFSLAFGPILIKDGKQIECYSYPIGEVYKAYTRAAIGQIDKLHYLYAHMGHYLSAGDFSINDFARYMVDKGVMQGYNLDGGQTAELVVNNKVVNWVDFGNERTVSDIIYFATALPEGE